MPGEWNATTTEVSYGSAAALDDLALAAFSISVWVNADTVGEGNTGRIATKRPTDDNGGWLFFTDATASLGFQTVDGASAAEANQRGANNAAPLNQWNQVILTYDDDGDQKGHIYVAGSEISYDTDTAGVQGVAASDADGNFILGNDEAASRTFDGHMAHFAVWNRVLTAGEIAALAAGYSPLFFLSGMQLYAPLDASTQDYMGNTATDTVAPDFTTLADPGKLRRPAPTILGDETAFSTYVPALAFGDHASEIPPRFDSGAGAPTHTALEGTAFWDTTNNVMYVNNDGSTAWTALN